MAENRKRPEESDDFAKPRDAGDPLAELARLIGQADPFADTARTRKPLDTFRTSDRPAPAPEWLARPAAQEEHDYDPRQDSAHYQRLHPHHVAPQAAEPQYEAADTHDYQGDDRYRVAPPPAGDYDGDAYYADDGHMPPHGDESFAPPRRRGGLLTIAAILGLAVIGTAGAFGYRAYTSGPSAPAEPPVIKADPSPAKIVPAQPAPAPTADAQGKPFQDRIGAAPAERIVPREEQPVALAVSPPKPATTQGQAFASTNPAPLVAPPPPAGALNEPKRVRTQIIRPDAAGPTGSANSASADPAAAAPPPPAARQNAKQSGQSGPLTIAPQPQPQPQQPAEPRTKMAARTPPSQAAGGAYVVQVSAQRTEAEAQSSYQALQQKYPAVLGSKTANIRRVDLGDKGGIFYRAQVGSFANSEAATAFCNDLKNAGGQCIVQKN